MTERTAGLARDRSRPSEHRYRLGVMGGTFDPIHHGDLVAASEVASRFALDEVVFVPTGRPWQKVERAVSEPEDRYLMTVIATASNPRFTVSRVDIDRPGPTYTVDTLRDLRTERGDDVDFYFITGADALSAILTWRGVEDLFDRPAHPYTHALMRARPALDATPGAPLNAIPGSVPPPGTVKSGCRFAARCARAQDICRQEMPPLEDLGDGHHVRCWYPH